MSTARNVDHNGFVTIKRNPISRSGIFQYSGAQIGLDAEPDKVYNVYRPAEEWEDPEALESVKHVPWIDDHVMLGGVDSEHMSPDQKGIHGITCDEVSFENGTVYANLKIFSRTLADLVALGKKQLSLGFRCAFEKAAGVFDGQPYQYRQGRIRANHLALVQAGRAGPEVAVLDHTTAFDHFDLALDTEEGTEMPEEVKHPTVDLTELSSIIKAAVESAVAPITARVDTLSEKLAADAAERDSKEKEEADKKAKAEEEEAKKKAEAEDAANSSKEKDEEAEKKKAEDEACAKAEAEKKDEKIAALDAELKKTQKIVSALDSKLTEAAHTTYRSIQQEAAAKASLANSLFPFTGVFDHSNMGSTAEVAAYGVEKLSIPVAEKGSEVAALKAYLHNRPAPSANEALALDEAANSNPSAANVKAFFRATK